MLKKKKKKTVSTQLSLKQTAQDRFTVVLTVVCVILFARFPTVKPIKERSAFYLCVETGTFWNSKWQSKIRLKISFEKCVCWRWQHNVWERKWRKSGSFSFIFLLKSLWHTKKAFYGRNMFDCRKTSKKNARYYSQDYFYNLFQDLWNMSLYL